MRFLVGFAWVQPPKFGWVDITKDDTPIGWREEILCLGFFGLVYEKRKLG